MPVWLLTCLSDCLSGYLTSTLSIYLSVYLPDCLSLYVSLPGCQSDPVRNAFEVVGWLVGGMVTGAWRPEELAAGWTGPGHTDGPEHLRQGVCVCVCWGVLLLQCSEFSRVNPKSSLIIQDNRAI